MPEWAIVLIVVGIVLVVGGLGYVVYRWGMKNTVVSKAAMSLASVIFASLRNIFPDDPAKLDAHDFMSAFDSLAKAGLEALKLKEEGKPFEEAKAMMILKVREIVDVMPGMKESVTDEDIEKIVTTAFEIVGYVPGLK